MAITITNVTNPDPDTYYRIFQEALPKIGHETARLGESELRRGMIRSLFRDDVICEEIKKDGYVVGYIATELITFRNSTYKHIIHPTVGQDDSGSRSWFYSDDHWTASRDKVAADGAVGIIAKHNPGSPAALGLASQYSNCTVETLTVSEVFPNDTNSPDSMRAFVITFP